LKGGFDRGKGEKWGLPPKLNYKKKSKNFIEYNGGKPKITPFPPISPPFPFHKYFFKEILILIPFE